jgi:hypothetical protein
VGLEVPGQILKFTLGKLSASTPNLTPVQNGVQEVGLKKEKKEKVGSL